MLAPLHNFDKHEPSSHNAATAAVKDATKNTTLSGGIRLFVLVGQKPGLLNL